MTDAKGGEEETENSLYYPNIDAFVEQYLAPMYDLPKTQNRVWCRQWWRHEGAVIRLHALWLSWEETRVHESPGTMASWILNIADPMMAVLFNPTSGPFIGCSEDRGHEAERPHSDGRLPCDPPPLGLFDPRR
ncbi:MAG: DUF4913 domain-containing protein [Schaalia hyovaginalis]|uniref:DUF4913 domain-containing protein n=1 Tax=Schaalia hyovaginalis TaxID=29316 RepID=UPI002A8291B9|nr:DUF4913 domain-containing protein [Schaalia hyovaginalis]MDY3666340.1 DUF4913 domain-containing protein [Schaalia hyovaginalis]MDY4263141.1 DUF4913 domain-containing protein [Schaalia hyovaginalis]